eukprot:TRINITY_DN9060_c0_g3_i2.p1 TRINITY_DN9060_c0_g3~~TRINITY_DN9060_c0_g3_i2.p1  ORF type:complete len:376 (-),score=14.22 TRINITY_DN9060_c0_g3_i2:9-1136(-)
MARERFLHLRNLTQLPYESLPNQDELNRTINHILRYVSSPNFDLTGHSRLLNEIPLVPVENNFLKLSRFFFRVEHEIPPFINKIPRVFCAHDELFRRLGVQEKPSPSDYARVLAELAQEKKGNPLAGPEKETILQTIRFVCSVPELSLKGLSYHVLDEKDCLVEAHRCVFNDCAGLATRVDRAQIKFVSPALSSVVLRIGVPPLTQAVNEVPDIEGVARNLSELASKQEIARYIRSKAFSGTLSALVQQLPPTKDLPSPAMLQSLLSSLEVRCSSSLKTQLQWRQGDQELVNVTRSHQQHVFGFIEQDRSRIWIQFPLPDQLRFEVVLSNLLLRYLNLTDVLKESVMIYLLDNHCVRLDPRVLQFFGFGDIEISF